MPLDSLKPNSWKKTVERSFDHRAADYEAHSDVQKRAAEELMAYLPDLDEAKILEIGCGTGTLTRALISKYEDAEFTISDISANMLVKAQDLIEDPRIEWRIMDGENPDYDQRYDLIVSNMCVQWFADIDASLRTLKALLKPGGELIYSMPGPETFKEWRAALRALDLTEGVLPFEKRDHVVAEIMFDMQCESGLDFLRRMKILGAHTPRDGYKPLNAKELKQACRFFEQDYQAKTTWQILFGRLQA